MHWKERIEQARERGGFTGRDRVLAGSWVTCACGEQDPRIPSYKGGGPTDVTLRHLGHLFIGAVDNDLYDEAEGLLEAIEKRAQEIIAAM